MPKQNLRSLSKTHYLPSRSLVSTKQKFYYRRNLLLKLKYSTHPDKIVGLIFFTTYHQKLPSGSKNFLYCVASLFSLILGKRYHSHHKPFKPAPYAQIHIHPHTNTHTCTYKSTPYHVRTASSSGEGEGKQQAFLQWPYACNWFFCVTFVVNCEASPSLFHHFINFSCSYPDLATFDDMSSSFDDSISSPTSTAFLATTLSLPLATLRSC